MTLAVPGLEITGVEATGAVTVKARESDPVPPALLAVMYTGYIPGETDDAIVPEIRPVVLFMVTPEGSPAAA